MTQFSIYTAAKTGTDGKTYGLRLLLTEQEAVHLQSVHVVPPLSRVVGMQEAADVAVAMIQKEQEVVQ